MPTRPPGPPTNAPGPLPRPAAVQVVTSCHDAYFRAFRSFRLDGFVLGRATGTRSVSRRQMASGVLECGVDAAPWAATGTVAEGAVAFVFAGSPDAQLRVDGRDVSRAVVRIGPAGGVAIIARRPADWFVLTVPATEAAGAGEPVLYRVVPEELSRLRQLARRLVGGAGTVETASATADAGFLEREVVNALAGLASDAPSRDRREGSSRVDRRDVLSRVEGFLRQPSSGPVYVADLCEATGIPERTLRYVFAEQYGTSPIRLLRNRRLCEFRRALRSEVGPEESLARIAGRHGFLHMGTLAADYRRLFGELPSESRRALGRGLPAPAASRAGARGPVGPSARPVPVLDGACTGE